MKLKKTDENFKRALSNKSIVSIGKKLNVGYMKLYNVGYYNNLFDERTNIFATDDLEYAKKYQNKFNDLLARLKTHYEKFDVYREDDEHEYVVKKFFSGSKIFHTTSCEIIELDYRSGTLNNGK